ncbi:hypothetical protein Gotur_029851 [Gossypium turneri]
MIPGYTSTSKKKKEIIYHFTSIHCLKLHCCVRRRIAILIRYTLKIPLVQY